jgi:hypothetical protein
MSIFTVFIFPCALVSLLPVSCTRNSAELVGEFCFLELETHVTRSVKKKISYRHSSSVVERERALGLECLFVRR